MFVDKTFHFTSKIRVTPDKVLAIVSIFIRSLGYALKAVDVKLTLERCIPSMTKPTVAYNSIQLKRKN
jgi:hypothetical protein